MAVTTDPYPPWEEGGACSQPPASDWDRSPQALPVLFPHSVQSSRGGGVTGGVTVDELWGAEEPREPYTSRDTFQADDLLHPSEVQ